MSYSINRGSYSVSTNLDTIEINIDFRIPYTIHSEMTGNASIRTADGRIFTNLDGTIIHTIQTARYEYEKYGNSPYFRYQYVQRGMTQCSKPLTLEDCIKSEVKQLNKKLLLV